jgi:hypothetical protein
MSLRQEPTTDTGSNQNARSDCQRRALPRGFVSSTEFREVAIAGTAGTEVIEPPVRFIERHRSRRNSLQNVHAWTPATLGIRKLLEQTTAKCVQKPLFFSRRISVCVQPFLLAANLKRPQFHSYAVPRLMDAGASPSEQCSAGSFPSCIGISFWLVVP